jgi:hypothetical protein
MALIELIFTDFFLLNQIFENQFNQYFIFD